MLNIQRLMSATLVLMLAAGCSDVSARRPSEVRPPLAVEVAISLAEDEDTLKRLLETGMDVNTPLRFAHGQPSGPTTLLHLAAHSGDAAVVEEIIRRGAGVNARDDLNMTALHYAAYAGWADVAGVLLASGADPDPEGSGDRRTPLLLAVIGEHADTVRVLMEYGADPRKRTSEGIRPLDVAGSAAIRDLLHSGH